ncbi:MAG TPA: response regulator [Ktedonobacterales bacterium]|jgi:CheY-like chemotaxis protein|nr:response regulator [Ktedonobacterales bacterium]
MREPFAVLNVGGELALRRTITMALVRHGIDVAEADSVAGAQEALAAWDGAFDVIVLDVCLRDQSGWDLLRRLRAQRSDRARRDGAIPVIVLTGGLPKQCQVDELHPDAVLPRPFPITTLVRLVERLAARHAAYPQAANA